MNKIIFTVTCITFIFCSVNLKAQSFEDIYLKHKKEQNITALEFNDMANVLPFLNNNQSNEKVNEFLKNTSTARVLVAKNNSHQAMEKDVRNYIKSKKLEKLMSVSNSDKNAGVDLYILDNNKTVNQIIVIISSQKDHIVVSVDGKYPMKMVQELIAESGSMKWN